MKKAYLLFALFCASLITGCADNKKTHKEISIEKKKINDTLVKATIITKYTTREKIKEEVQVIEGTPGEVNAQLDTYKKQVLQEQENQSMLRMKKCKRKK